jgi:hypothetical protein
MASSLTIAPAQSRFPVRQIFTLRGINHIMAYDCQFGIRRDSILSKQVDCTTGNPVPRALTKQAGTLSSARRTGRPTQTDAKLRSETRIASPR